MTHCILVCSPRMEHDMVNRQWHSKVNVKTVTHLMSTYTSAYRAGPVADTRLSTIVTAVLIVFQGLAYIDFGIQRPNVGTMSKSKSLTINAYKRRHSNAAHNLSSDCRKVSPITWSAQRPNDIQRVSDCSLGPGREMLECKSYDQYAAGPIACSQYLSKPQRRHTSYCCEYCAY